MKLYHYSREKFSSLQTLNFRTKKKDCYGNHISFFIEPVNYAKIPGYFKDESTFWVSGAELYEYVVDSRTLKDYTFYLVETPEQTKLFYDTSISDEEFEERLRESNKRNGYIGTTNTQLEQACRKFLGKTDKYFARIKSYPNFDELKLKYAGTVPHLMIYFLHGDVKYQSVKTVRLGEARISNHLSKESILSTPSTEENATRETLNQRLVDSTTVLANAGELVVEIIKKTSGGSLSEAVGGSVMTRELVLSLFYRSVLKRLQGC